ncbi:MAG TPA: hypothetical protein VJ997_05570, partial [Longimicrobiales bacterium]|nr:hypothetical protein [Longimicrobiales bacterium]
LFTVRTPHAQRLTMVGMVAALALPGPYLGVFNGAADHVQVAAEILALILLLHFLLLFPRTKRLARSPLVGLLYIPWLALLGCLVAELVTHPRLYHAFGGFIGLLVLGYAVAAVGVLIHTAATTPGREWRASGLGLLLAGWALALVPNLVAVAGWFIPPGFNTPGQRYFPLLLVAIPVSMALAVRREAARRQALRQPSNDR